MTIVPQPDALRRERGRGQQHPRVADLDLHHLYRTMGWLGEELANQNGRSIGPRTTKDLVEERLFALRNSLFTPGL